MTEKLVTIEDVLIWHTNLAKHGDESSLTKWHQGAAEAVKEAIAAPLPLTDAQIDEVWLAAPDDWDDSRAARLFARALEKAHGIGQQTAAALPHPPVEPECHNCEGLGYRREANGEKISCDLCDAGLMRTIYAHALFAMGHAGANHDTAHELRPAWELAQRLYSQRAAPPKEKA